jgi:hypothetical protein
MASCIFAVIAATLRIAVANARTAIGPVESNRDYLRKV